MNLRTLSSFALLPLLLLGCSDPDNSGTTTTGTMTATGTTTAGPTTTGTGTTTGTTGATGTTGGGGSCLSMTAADGSPLLMANPANNYSFTSNVVLDVLKVAPNASLNFDWSALNVDLMQHPIDPAGDVVTVLFALLQLTPEDFQTKLNANERLNSYSSGALALYTMGTLTSGNVYEMVAPGTTEALPPEEIEPYLNPDTFDPAKHTYAVLVQDSLDPAQGVRMVQALQLDPESLTTDVAVTNTSATMTYDTNIAAVVPVQVPGGSANFTVDWSTMEVNGLGGTWQSRSIDEVMIGHYMATPDELTARFLDLDQESFANKLYRGPVEAGNSLNVSTLTDSAGQPFTGIDGTGTWIVALNCSECTNPAPWFLTILQPCAG